MKNSKIKTGILLTIVMILLQGLTQNELRAAVAADPKDTRNFITTLFWGIVGFSLIRVIKKEFSDNNDPGYEYSEQDSSSRAYQYLFSHTEDEAFDTLTSELSRRAYIDSFWQDFTSGPYDSPAELRMEYESRVKYANNHYAEMHKRGWRTDRGRVHIIYGNPAEIIHHPLLNDSYLRQLGQKWSDIEVWYYHYAKGKNSVPALFRLLDDGRMFFVFTSPMSGYKYEQIFSTEITEKSSFFDF